MLELSIIHDPGEINGRVDLGRILEAMLYYDRVHLIMNAGLFVKLWTLLGRDDFAAFLGHPTLSVTLTPEMLGVHNHTVSAVTTHRPIMFKIAGKSPVADIHEKDTVGSLLHMIRNTPSGSEVSRGQVNKLAKLAKDSRYSKILGSPPEHHARFAALVKDPETLKLFVRGFASANGKKVNEIALATAEISVSDVGDSFWITSTVPLENIVEGWDRDENWGAILPQIQDYAIELYLSHAHSADIITRSDIAEVASARVDLSLQRAMLHGEQISSFQELAFEEAHIFADAYNEGLLTLAEALKIIDKSRRFREWTRGLPPDANLITEYHQAVIADTALGSLPASIARFAFFNGGGMVADSVLPGSGLIASAIDTYIVDRLLGGWRPNVFVRNVRHDLDKKRRQAWETKK